jgi:GNAT superfamily N-acetyltransferase
LTDDVIRLQEGQIPALRDAMSRAFWDDPMSVHILPDLPHRGRCLPLYFGTLIRYGHLFGQVFSTAANDGVAVWLPPDSGEMTDTRWEQAGAEEMMTAFGAEAMRRMDAFFLLAMRLHARGAPMPHGYLMLLGVEPHRQRQGLGSRLLGPCLRQADAGGYPCYLETVNPDNLPFYRTHGFRVLEEQELPDGPRVWSMRRDPRG